MTQEGIRHEIDAEKRIVTLHHRLSNLTSEMYSTLEQIEHVAESYMLDIQEHHRQGGHGDAAAGQGDG